MSKHNKIIIYDHIRAKVDRLKKCKGCAIPFKFAEEIYTKRGSNSLKKHYCLKCAKKYNLI